MKGREGEGEGEEEEKEEGEGEKEEGGKEEEGEGKEEKEGEGEMEEGKAEGRKGKNNIVAEMGSAFIAYLDSLKKEYRVYTLLSYLPTYLPTYMYLIHSLTTDKICPMSEQKMLLSNHTFSRSCYCKCYFEHYLRTYPTHTCIGHESPSQSTGQKDLFLR